jgi:hypothetical protein
MMQRHRAWALIDNQGLIVLAGNGALELYPTCREAGERRTVDESIQRVLITPVMRRRRSKAALRGKGKRER